MLYETARQRVFVSSNIQITSKKSSTTFGTSEGASRTLRNYSRKYYFTIKNEKIQIYKTMFLQTLAISDKVVINICINLKTSPIFPEN